MSEGSTTFRPAVDPAVLDALAARAGLALACPYANSAEYEAEIVARRRAEGAYAGRRMRSEIWCGALLVATLLLLIALV
jgi:hypothetical protein